MSLAKDSEEEWAILLNPSKLVKSFSTDIFDSFEQ